MRIIAGKLGGRQFDSPKSKATHPMSEKIRGAIFNSLGDIEGLTVLDAFAGSGALSFEAISRGAQLVTSIDNDKSAQRVIFENAKSLQLGNFKLIKAGAGAWLETVSQNFDIVLLDPPYDKTQPKLLERLSLLVKVHGIVVLSLPPNNAFELGYSFNLLSSKSYGDAVLTFYRRV